MVKIERKKINKMEDNDLDMANKNQKYSNNIFLKIIFNIFLFSCLVLVVFFTIHLYISFAALVMLTFYLFVHDWLSLFSKNTVNMVISVFYNFSNFGLIFNLSLFCYFIILNYFSIINSIIKRISLLSPNKLKNDSDRNKFTFLFFMLTLLFTMIAAIAVTFFDLSTIIFSAIFEIYLIIFLFNFPVLVSIFACTSRYKIKKSIDISESIQDNNNNEEVRSYSGHTSNENHTENEINKNYSNEEESSDITNTRNTNDEDNINEETEIQSNEYISDSNDTETYDITDLFNHRLNKIIYYLIKNEEVIYIANIKGMYDKSRKSCKCRLLFISIYTLYFV